jgi:hypothetical protein
MKQQYKDFLKFFDTKTKNICNLARQRVNTGPLIASEWEQALAFTKRNFCNTVCKAAC